MVLCRLIKLDNVILSVKPVKKLMTNVLIAKRD